MPGPETQPGARIDTITTNLAGTECVRSDYAGTVWFGGRPMVTSGMVLTRTGGGAVNESFWLPDSLVYDTTTNVQVQATVTLQSIAHQTAQLVDFAAGLSPENSGSERYRVYLAVNAALFGPTAVSYRVTVVCPRQAVVSASP